jgi:apolipoprotein D and lipocalin family protein
VSVKLPILPVTILCGAAALICGVTPARRAIDPPEKQELQTVASVDLNRYMGDWYEIARTYNRYEAHCVADVKVHYELLPDGRMGLRNECRQSNGKTDSAHGHANIVDAVSKAKLRVTFFWPFFADYWIIDLDKDYRYAVVGEPDRKYLWIISRTPRLDAAEYQQLLKRIGEQGYDISKVQKTEQSQAIEK